MDVVGPFHDEAELVVALRQINRRSGVENGEITVHVYRTHVFDEWVGRRYLGCMDATTILMTEDVNEDRLT
jgi:hypothetical protein